MLWYTVAWYPGSNVEYARGWMTGRKIHDLRRMGLAVAAGRGQLERAGVPGW